MKTEYKHFRFNPAGVVNTAQSYECIEKRNGACLGGVAWMRKWQEYVFIPEIQEEVKDGPLFSGGCLADIQHFIKQLMDARAALLEQKEGGG